MAFSFGIDAGGIIGGILSKQSQDLANAIAWQQLQWQKQQAAKELRFAQAGRTDAYGNKQRFNDLLNEWELNLTPMQKAITTAQEREQYLSLTEDAMRNRERRRIAAKRGREAGRDYNTALQGYRYDQPGSERSIRNEIAKLIAGTKEDAARRSTKEINRTLLRQGRGALLPTAFNAQNEALGGDISQTLLDARTQGVQEKAARDQAHQSKYLPAIEYFAKLMDAGPDAPVHFSNLSQEKSNEQGQMANLILNAMRAGNAQVGSAYNALISSLGKPVSFGSSKIGFSSRGGTTQQSPDANGNSTSIYVQTPYMGPGIWPTYDSNANYWSRSPSSAIF